MSFFTNEEIQINIKEYLSLYKMPDDDYVKVKTVLNDITTDQIDSAIFIDYLSIITLNLMKSYPEEWDLCSLYTVESLGAQFTNYLINIDKIKGETSRFYLVLFRFFLEFYTITDLDLGHEVHDVYLFLKNHDSNFFDQIPEDHKRQLTWILSVSPVLINKHYLNLRNIKPIKNMYDEIIEINNNVLNYNDNWDNNLKKREVKIDALENKLKDYQQEYNFVALNKGFQNLGDKKYDDLIKATKSVNIWMFWSLLMPVLSSLFFLYESNPFVFIPTSSILIMTLFFYRVALLNKNSIKSQILQIDLRKTLCQFIESYSEFSVDLKSKNEHTLKKFEDLIFSGLVASDEKLPTTFDGANQLSSLFKNIKK
ncbi:MAG: hypothetical protein HRT37_04550 [Alteromonadaceae bacterium]|nr:hypothetical protein [Alteromonadaceae bacterium]